MTDVVSPNIRSKMMSGIRGTNTKPELIIRKELHKKGIRYKLYDKNLPGRPDMVLAKYKAVIFINGCFWHKHNCHLFKWPQSRKEFWEEKINGNVARDYNNELLLREKDWRIGLIWECALKGKKRLPVDTIIEKCIKWLQGTSAKMEIQGYE